MLREGKIPSVAVLFGDDLKVQSACKSIIDLVVPPEQRAFNMERFDGRSVGWDRIELSLMTPPFFSGKKLVWVENAPYFFSRDQKGELCDKILQLWSEDKKDEAGKLLLDILAVQGWTPERWEQAAPESAGGSVVDLLAPEDYATGATLHQLVGHCKSKGFQLKPRLGSEENAILALLDAGLPPWDFLLLTPIQVDRRTRIYKRFNDIGAVLSLDFERDRFGRISPDEVREFVTSEVRRSGKNMEPRARESILMRSGDDLRSLQQEIEKLLLYTGERTTIRADDVQAIMVDQAGGWIFDLTRLIAAREASAALSQLARLMSHGDHPLKLLATIAAEIRKLLTARHLMENGLRGRWRRGMTYNQFQRSVLDSQTTLLTRNPYADYMCLQRAENFSLQELVAHLGAVHDADLRLKSTGANPRMILEGLILRMCVEGRRGDAPDASRSRS